MSVMQRDRDITETALKVELEATILWACIKMLKASMGEDFKI